MKEEETIDVSVTSSFVVVTASIATVRGQHRASHMGVM